MELTKGKDLQICSLRQLFYELDRNLPDRKTIAIILTVGMLNNPALRLLDNFYKAGVYDTESEDDAFSFDNIEAIKVKDFLDCEKDFGRLYVCCDSGESRSTAMAAAILKYYGKSDKEIWTNPHYHPNLLVYRKQLYAFGIKAGKLRLKYLKHINNRALKRVINMNK